jgi:glucuronoarabinoxylan endo-1,4-beta-xylanase
VGTPPSGVRKAPIVASFALDQNYPNPFNPTTVVKYQLPVAGDVRLGVYDLLGREVAVLVNERKMAGTYEVRFDASGLSSGVYVYRLTSGVIAQSRRMVVLK